jgi:predicted ATPase
VVTGQVRARLNGRILRLDQSAGRPAVDPDGRPLSAPQPHPAEAQGEDASHPIELASAELIFRRGVPPDAEYTFRHALVQDAAYSTLLRARRQQLHGRIVTTLENQFPEVVTAQPTLMAQHCTEAGLSDKAVGYWLKAGQQA